MNMQVLPLSKLLTVEAPGFEVGLFSAPSRLLLNKVKLPQNFLIFVPKSDYWPDRFLNSYAYLDLEAISSYFSDHTTPSPK